ncbi:MAG: preprotein translocase subunit SecG [Muribaculaceae bacterium]|nr:preprotein translocase subunit SecG [Muribaculaceae bacterium]
MFYILLTVLILIAALLLIGVVLIQKSKGGGLASNFQGANQIMGVKSATNFVEKATWGLAIIICVLSILSAFAAPRTLVQGTSKVKAQAPQEQTSTAFPTEKATPAAPTTPATPVAPAPAK